MWIDPRIGRLILIALGVLFFGYGALKQTPELDGVKNASIYRGSLFFLLLRANRQPIFDHWGVPIIESTHMIETKTKWIRKRRSWRERLRKPQRWRIKYKPVKIAYTVPSKQIFFILGSGIGGAGGHFVAHPTIATQIKAELASRSIERLNNARQDIS